MIDALIRRIDALKNPTVVGLDPTLEMIPGYLKEEIRQEFLVEGRDPAECIYCNSCVKACPQHIKIPEVMLDFSKKLPTLSGWDEVCKAKKEKA